MATQQKRPVISGGRPSQPPAVENAVEQVEGAVKQVESAVEHGEQVWMERLRYPAGTLERIGSLDVVRDERERLRTYVRQVGRPPLTTTDDISTIPSEWEPWLPGDEHVQRRISTNIRCNAAMIVHRMRRPGIGAGGHSSADADSASLDEVGFSHFFRGRHHPGDGDHNPAMEPAEKALTEGTPVWAGEVPGYIITGQGNAEVTAHDSGVLAGWLAHHNYPVSPGQPLARIEDSH